MPGHENDKPLLTARDAQIYDDNPLARWVWRANEGACIDCLARDGRKYFYPDALKLERPHPNCRCTLEIVGAEKASQDETIHEVEEPYPGAILRDLYKPKESDGWNMPVIDFFSRCSCNTL